MGAIKKFFKDIFSLSDFAPYSECKQVIHNCVSQAMNDSFVSQVSSGEVEKIVSSLEALKASGPNGLKRGVFSEKLGHH